jgi:hypothetical protein
MGIPGEDFCFINRVAELAAGALTQLIDGQVSGHKSIYPDTGDTLVMLYEDWADDLHRGRGVK